MPIKEQDNLKKNLISEVKKLHFHTKQLITQTVTGRYRSAFRGSGIEFEELREYFPGDDIRTIDWKVTAKVRKPFVKIYREERELSIIIAVDTSSSILTGTKSEIKEHLAAKVAAALTFIALNNNDKVGLITFSDKLDTYFPPRKARNSVWRIIYHILNTTNLQSRRTNLNDFLEFIGKVCKRRSVIFFLSDFIDDDFEKPLKLLAKNHDFVAISITDPADFNLPDSGIIRIKNPETNEITLVDSSDSVVREHYREEAIKFQEERKTLFRRLGIGQLELSTSQAFMPEIKRFFNQRAKRG
ncbi:MAG: DUF58 domain-containing protein [Proteobacteria bacterium]|nr:DUF58 domain-containing protein [Pseudomonadota bacterium]